MIRTLIVDDEPLARARIRRFLASEKDVEIVGESGDGRTAVADVKRLKPDLMFLDIQLPETPGLEVVEQLANEQMPVVVFVTAYDQYAIQAFDVHALDYLLKPYTRERFGRALDRARKQLSNTSRSEFDQRLMSLLENAASGGEHRHLQRLMIKSSGRIYFIKADEVDWIGAEGNYVNLHVGREAHLLRETMSHLATKLDPEKFVRIHRSTIVNVDRVKELQPLFSGDYVAILHDGTQLNLSRAYREKSLKLFGGLE
jgi:two-component system, LytTR family, response regulator